MFLLTFSAVCGLLALTSFGGEGSSAPSATTAAAGAGRLCAIGPGTEFQTGCSIERASGSAAFVINHPDGAQALLSEAAPAGEVRLSLDGDRHRIEAGQLGAGTP